jgi:hypothetical protein
MRKEKSVVPAQGSCRTFGGERLRKRLWPLWWPKRISLWQFVITADRPFQEYCLPFAANLKFRERCLH